MAVVGSALRNVPDKLKLVGTTSGDHVIGKWTTIHNRGKCIDFLPVIHERDLQCTLIKSLNLRFALAMARHYRAICEPRVRSVFTQTWSVLWFFTARGRGNRVTWDICYYYPGFGNAMRHGRHPTLGRCIAFPYDFIHAKAVARANLVLAAASQQAVEEHRRHLRRFKVDVDLYAVPTAVDLDFFKAMCQEAARKELNLPQESLIIIFVGRLAKVKGIPLLFSMLKHVHAVRQDALLILVGSGEEHDRLLTLANGSGLVDRIVFVGLQPPEMVRKYIAGSDVCVCASFTEGFSLSMIEQIACGRPIVSTNVSGAEDIIVQGENGFVLTDRDPETFAKRVLEAVAIPGAGCKSRRIAEEKYSEKEMWHRIAIYWEPLR